MKIYQRLAGRCGALHNCERNIETVAPEHKEHWMIQMGSHANTIAELMNDAPSGSGIDSGTKIDTIVSCAEKLKFTFGYHHMDDMGGYTEWSFHELIVTADLIYGIHLTFEGAPIGDGTMEEDYDEYPELYDYLHDTFYDWMTSEE